MCTSKKRLYTKGTISPENSLMQNPYKNIKKVWDGIYERANDYADKLHPDRILPQKDLERGLEWMLENRRKTVMDFGCGSGRVLFRCLTYGAENVIGIDLSKQGIGLARARARMFNVEDRMTFINGGVEKLAEVQEVIDCAVLFNIIDNLLPEDAQRAVSDLTKKMRARGRVLLNMSDYFERRILVEEDGAEEIGPNSYRERTGLFFLNLTDGEIESLFDAFKVCRKLKIRISKDNLRNRLWHLEKNS